MTSSNKTTFYIVRHGESAQNAKFEKDQTCDQNAWGTLESPLTDKGKKQVEETAQILSTVKFDAAYSSHLTRAVQTGEIIVNGRGIEIIQIPDLREIRVGDEFFSLSAEQKIATRAYIATLSYNEMINYRWGADGETSHEGLCRFIPYLNKLAKAHVGQTILIANHGNMMRKLLLHLGWATYSQLLDGSIENAGYYVIETNGSEYVVKETYKVNKSN